MKVSIAIRRLITSHGNMTQQTPPPALYRIGSELILYGELSMSMSTVYWQRGKKAEREKRQNNIYKQFSPKILRKFFPHIFQNITRL